MNRPRHVIAVVGTNTEVGKTWFGAQLAEAARRAGLSVAARKPVQSFDPGDADTTDAHVLATASGEDPHTVCPRPRWYPAPMAPPMAAEALGRAGPRLGSLMTELVWPDGPVDLGLVETVGGVRSPVTVDGDSRDLVRALAPDLVVLVAHAGLGTLNDVRLAVDALDGLRVAVFLNRHDPADDLHLRNRAWLEQRDGFLVDTDAAGMLRRLV